MENSEARTKVLKETLSLMKQDFMNIMEKKLATGIEPTLVDSVQVKRAITKK